MIMKKRRFVIIAVFILAFFLLIAGVFIQSIRLPQCSADITGNIVDNDYNNILSGGNLVRINNKLYYNYTRSSLSYGLIEISKNGSRRIYWEGLKTGSYHLEYPIRPHNGSLTMELEDGIKNYAADTNAFEEYMPFNTIPEISLCFQETDLGMVYESKVSPGVLGNLCVYDGSSVKVIAEEIYSFYADDCDIYYYVPTSPIGQSGEFRKYCMVDKTDVSVCELYNYSSVYTFVLERNYLLFKGRRNNDPNNPNYSVFKINLNNADKEVEFVCCGDDSVSDYQYDIQCLNVYNGTIYVGSHFGLAAYDLSSNEKRELYGGLVEECYIVDDKWVYFVDGNASLWRVLQTGGNAELVFG